MLFRGVEIKYKKQVTDKKIDRYGNVEEMWIHKKKCKLWKMIERIRSLKDLFHLLPPMSRRMILLSGKVSFYISLKKIRKASLAVETALVLPLFFLGMITMISFMDIYKLQTEHLSALCEKTREAGMYAYALDGSGPEEITLPDIYFYEPVGGLVPLPKVWMHNTVKVHAWTGKEFEVFQDGEASDGESEEMVYVTESGSVYHKKLDCTYLDLSVNRISGSAVASMRNASGERYGACEICSRNQNPAASVYITKTGNRYHNLESCSGLKRTVRLVKHSHAEGMGACSRCG